MPTTETGDRPALNREAIVAAGRRIADTEGLGALTLRRVAAEFDTGQASLYRHIANRAELLGLLADDLAAAYPIVTAEDTDPTTRVIRQWAAIHDHLVEHAWAARLIADGEHLGSGAGRTTAELMGQLERTGIDSDNAARAYRAIWHFLLGHLLTSHPFGHVDIGSDREQPGAPILQAEADGFIWALRRLLAGMALENTVSGEAVGGD